MMLIEGGIEDIYPSRGKAAAGSRQAPQRGLWTTTSSSDIEVCIGLES